MSKVLQVLENYGCPGFLIELDNYGDEVEVYECYDVDTNESMLEVFETVNGDAICTVWGETFPDPDDPDYDLIMEDLLRIIDDEACLFS